MKATAETTPLRSVIVTTLAVLLAVTVFPGFSGGQEPLARFIIGGAVLLALVLLWHQPQTRRLKGGPLVWSYLLFTGWTACSLIWSVNRYSTVVWLIQLLLAGLVFRLSYSLAGEPAGRRRFELGYLVGVGLFAAYAVWLYLTGGYNRLTGWFYWANPAAAYLIPAILIAWSHLGGARRWLWSAVAVLAGAAFILTDSRFGTLVFVLVGVPMALLVSKKKTIRINIVFTVILAVILSLAAVQVRHQIQPHSTATVVPGSRFAAAVSGESRSGSDRINFLASAFDIWYDHPLVGTGGGTYPDVHPRYQLQVVSASTSAHNIYVQTLAELGLVGVILLGWLMLALLFGLLRAVWREPVALAYGLGALALFLHMGLDIDAGYPALIFLAAALAGLTYRQHASSRQKLSWHLPLAAAFGLVVLINLYQSDVYRQRGEVAQDNGDYPTAAGYFERAHSGFVFDPDVINAEGIDYYTEALSNEPGAAALALDRARTAERLDPNDSQHYQLEGRVLEVKGDRAGAEAAFRTALKLDPYNHPDYAYDLGSLLLSESHGDEALTTAQTMLDRYPAAVITNRAADPTLTSHLASLDALVAQIKLTKGDVAGARKAVAAGLGLDKTNLYCRALANQLSKLPN